MKSVSYFNWISHKFNDVDRIIFSTKIYKENRVFDTLFFIFFAIVKLLIKKIFVKL